MEVRISRNFPLTDFGTVQSGVPHVLQNDLSFGEPLDVSFSVKEVTRSSPKIVTSSCANLAIYIPLAYAQIRNTVCLTHNLVRASSPDAAVVAKARQNGKRLRRHGHAHSATQALPRVRCWHCGGVSKPLNGPFRRRAIFSSYYYASRSVHPTCRFRLRFRRLSVPSSVVAASRPT